MRQTCPNLSLDWVDSGIHAALSQLPLAQFLVKQTSEVIVYIKSKAQHPTAQGVEFLLVEHPNLALDLNRHGRLQ